jgi:hypothetical protein
MAAAAPPVLSFVVVGPRDAPAYEADLAVPAPTASTTTTTTTTAPPASSGRDERSQYLHAFILHAALDAVADAQDGAGGGGGGGGGVGGVAAVVGVGGGGGSTAPGAPYHGVVDRFNNLLVRLGEEMKQW